MREKVVEFSHHIGSLEVINLLMDFAAGKFFVVPPSKLDGMHLIVHVITEMRGSPACIHS